MYYIMPKKINKRNKTKKNNKTQKNRKQKQIIMIGCSKKNKKSCKNKKTFFSPLANNCPNCGPNCHCGPNCNCPHPCPGTCYLNRRHKGGNSQGCGSCGCPISPLSLNEIGGNSYGPILGIAQNGGNEPQPIPPPMIGSPWGINNLPGQSGIPGDANYFKPSNTNENPQLQISMNNSGYKNPNSMVGGNKKTKSYKRKCDKNKFDKSKRGGGFTLIPQDLTNLGSAFNYNLQSAYNTLNGYKTPVSPLPYEHKLPNKQVF